MMERILGIIARYLLGKLLHGYVLPFQKADERFFALSNAERAEYIRSAKMLAENEAFICEMEEWKRKLYSELALSSKSEMSMTAYRLTIKSVLDFQDRIKKLSSMNASQRNNDIADKM